MLAAVRSAAELARLKTAKGCHEVFDLASRRGFTGFEVALNAESGEEGLHARDPVNEC